MWQVLLRDLSYLSYLSAVGIFSSVHLHFIALCCARAHAQTQTCTD